MYTFSSLLLPITMSEQESNESITNKLLCEKCGFDSFRVYIDVIIDDARLYCLRCNNNQL